MVTYGPCQRAAPAPAKRRPTLRLICARIVGGELVEPPTIPNALTSSVRPTIVLVKQRNSERSLIMKKLAIPIAILTLLGTANAADFSSLGYREDTVISEGGRYCGGPGTLIYNHAGYFQNGYCWQDGGVAPPYYGAFAESFPGCGVTMITCEVFWLTQIGYYSGQTIDVYVWHGGVTSPPAGVICMASGIGGLEIGFWPECTINEIEPGFGGGCEDHCCPNGDFTIGYWCNWTGPMCPFYVCADEVGGGTEPHPWTCAAPGSGYPTGWIPANQVFPGIVSLGIGAKVLGGPSPAESRTWGAIKALYE